MRSVASAATAFLSFFFFLIQNSDSLPGPHGPNTSNPDAELSTQTNVLNGSGSALQRVSPSVSAGYDDNSCPRESS